MYNTHYSVQILINWNFLDRFFKNTVCLFVCCCFVFLALQPIVVVFSQPGSGL